MLMGKSLLIASARDLIKYHEGCVLTAKPDDRGMWKIGWGHILPTPATGAPPLRWSQSVADSVFEQDFIIAAYDAVTTIGRGAWGLIASAPRQGVIIDMSYKMRGLSDFKKTVTAAVGGDWTEAARQVFNEWSEDYFGRAFENATILLTGRWPFQ